MKTRKIFIFICILTAIGYAKIAYSISPAEAVQKFQARMYSAGNISGGITITYKDGMIYSGSFKYKSYGQILVKFDNPSGKTISSNGRKLWVYDSSTNICGIQDLAGGGSGGILGFVKTYTPVSANGGSSGYTIKLKNEAQNISAIIIITDGSFLLKKAVFESRDGDSFSIAISAVRLGENIPPGIFDFNVPGNAQTVTNPLDVR